MRKNSTKLIILAVIAITCMLLFALYDIQGGFSYAFPKRLERMFAMVITGTAIAFASIAFQTVTQNRLLTPSVMGIDSMYEIVQTIIYFALGSTSIFVVSRYLNFGVSIIAMVLFALILYRFLFRADKHPIFLLLLAGMVIGTLLGSLGTFMQVIIDPVEYESLQARLFASFMNVKTELLFLSAGILVLAFLYGTRILHKLDVMALGRDNAMNLGVDYDKMVLRILILSSILIAVSTALVGPITFLGLIVSNLAYQYFATYKHSVLIIGASLISIIALVGGQFLVLQGLFPILWACLIMFLFLSEFFIFLLLKESRKAG